MNAPIAAHWFSGQELVAHPVTLVYDGATLHLEGLAAPRRFTLEQVRVSDRLGRTPRFLYFPDGSSAETSENDAVDAWLATRSRGRGSALIHWLEQRSRVAAAATVLLVASVAALAFYGLPVLAHRAAQAVPPRIERQAGEVALQALERMLQASELSARERARVTAQMDRITRARGITAAARIEFRSMGRFPNAFALPGGILIVSDELARMATDEELAAVLAHETAHWQLRHGVQSVFRNSAALLVVSTITGDLSTLTTFASTLPLLLLQNGYSREFEQEADHYAVETLRLAQIDPRYLATILTKLERKRPDSGRDFSYLSTHPATKDRAARIDPSGSYVSLIRDPEPDQPAPPPAAARPQPGTLALAPKIDVPPRAISQVAPEYPPSLRYTGVQGNVSVEFIVDTEGRVREPKILQSTHSDFDTAVLAALIQWRFEPGRLRGKKVNCRARLEFPFTLSEETAAPAPAETGAPAPAHPRTVDELLARAQAPVLTRQVSPEYPAALVAARAEGQVVVTFHVATTGIVSRAKVKSSSDPRFDTAALAAVNEWTFAPQPDLDPRVLLTQEVEFDFKIVAAPEAPVGEVTVRYDGARAR